MLDRLKLLIRSENSIIALDTRDEVQGVELVRKAADDMAVPLFEWTVTAGMTRTKPTAGETGVEGGMAGDRGPSKTRIRGSSGTNGLGGAHRL